MLDQEVLELISKEAMQQYEIARKSGICNYDLCSYSL